MTKVAFIGLGHMGAPQARLIAKAPSMDLAVYDPFEPALQAFEGLARLATSPADAGAGAEIACVCVRDDDQVRTVLFGEGGLTETLAPGSLVLIHSTIRIETLRELRAACAEKGIGLLDSSVSRTRPKDDQPFVVSIVGGDEDEVARARPVQECFSTDIIHAGPAGAGIAAKIANNHITWVHIVTAVQSMETALANGVTYESLRAILAANGNLTPSTQAIMDGRYRSASDNPLMPDETVARSQAGIGEKDLTIAAERMAAAGVDDSLVLAAREAVHLVMTGKPTG